MRLNINAGWYSKPSVASDSFVDCAERYASARCDGSLTSGHDSELMPLAAMPLFRKKSPMSWSDDLMLSRLRGARVVFVTSFADEVHSITIRTDSGDSGANCTSRGI
jgi:hypothetical protein